MRKFVLFLTILSGCAFCLLLGFYIGVRTVRDEPLVLLPEPGVLTYAAQDSGSDFEAVPVLGSGAQAAETELTEAAKNAEDVLNEDTYDPNEDFGGFLPVMGDNYVLPPSVRLGRVPVILQNPELPRGCEVTALAMLMKFCGIETDKLTLAGELKKDLTPREIKNGKTFWGNPNNGFIGNMYDASKAGFGVYHAPVFELLQSYEPERAVDLTGCSFLDLQWALNNGMPVWVIINTTYAPLGESSFVTWDTPDGNIKITWREHAALITGYDETSVYLNDPLSSFVRTPKDKFILCWEQMGAQAITLRP